MKTHTFSTKLSNGIKVENRIAHPSAGDAFDVEAWRTSGFFRPEDDDATIRSKVMEGYVRSAVIDLQRHLRTAAGGQREANDLVEAWRHTETLTIKVVPAALYDSLTDDQLALFREQGIIMRSDAD